MFFVSEVMDAMEVFAIGVGLDTVGKFTIGVVVHMISTKENTHRVFIPALGIGHVIEKTTAFFVLVSGEILMAVTYVAKDHAQIGPHTEYGRSCLGIVMAFSLCWIYFDADSSKIFVHAIRCVHSSH
jgi:low temperature requirement protein LtrA